MDFITNLLNTPLIPIGNNNYLTVFTLLLAVIVVLLLFIFLSVLSKAVKSKREERETDAYETYCKITKWQKLALPQIFAKYDSKGDLNYILNYANENDVWYTDELTDYDFEIVKKANQTLFMEVRNNFNKPDYCFSILHTIDAMNGGLDVNADDEYEPWISDKISTGSISDRLKVIFTLVIRHLQTRQETSPGKKIPEEIIKSALLDIRDSDAYAWENDTYKILILATTHFISDTLINKTLNDVGLSYIRVLASLFDRCDYMESLEALED